MARLDPVSLRLFVSIVEEGTISAAAAREHLAAAAVSKRISEMEDVLQSRLLTRTNKGVVPTAAGIALLSLARRALREFDDIAVQMQGYASGLRGHVRIFANISAITQFLPGEMKSFMSAHPHVHVQLEENISSVIAKAVAESAADVGILSATPLGQDLEVFPYHSDKLVVVTPARHALANRKTVHFSDALDFPFVGLHTGSAINLQLFKSASELERTLNLRIQVTSYDALCLMVHAGLGVGVLPENVARHHARLLNLRVLKLYEPWAHRELKICVRSFDALPVAARLFVTHLQRCVANAQGG